MFDPLQMAERARALACSDGSRKYYRFRPARFYGGIATADCLGCPLRCVFCWASKQVSAPDKYGRFYTPDEVAGRLVSIAKKKRLSRMRISGNEPTLCKDHLLRVLQLIPENYEFILETNGIPIGSDPGFAGELSRFPNLYVRVSLKGTCEEEFSRLTGAVPEGFRLQLKALELLMEHGVEARPACMVSFSPPGNIKALGKRLRSIHPEFEDFEVEELILYPAVEKRLSQMGVRYYTAYRPDGIPAGQV